MKFNLSAVTVPYAPPEARREFEALGFCFEDRTFGNDPTIFTMQKYDNSPQIEFNDVEEIIEFVKKWGPIIIEIGIEPKVIIYNDSIE